MSGGGRRPRGWASISAAVALAVAAVGSVALQGHVASAQRGTTTIKAVSPKFAACNNDCTITGTVTDGTNPLQNISVVALNQFNQFGQPEGAPGCTAGDGTYHIDNLNSGPYVIRFDNNGEGCGFATNAAAGGWVTQFYQGQSQFNNASPQSAPNTNINATMAPGAAISGTVFRADTGNPLGNICVNANRANGGGGGGFGGGAFAQTANDGTYTLNNLDPGQGPYQVQFNDCGGNSGAGSWVQQWWESASDGGSFTPVAVTAGTTVSSIDALMLPGGTITGQVTGSDLGENLAGICVSVDTGAGQQFGGPQLSTSTNNNVSGPNYTLTGLPLGKSYKIRFDNSGFCPHNGPGGAGNWVTQWWHGASSFAKANPVNVPKNTTPVTGINAVMVQGGSISGQVTDGGGVQGFCVAVDPGLPGGVVTQVTQTDNNGNYTLHNLAASVSGYKIRFDSYSCQFGNFGPNPNAKYETRWWDGTANGAATLSGAASIPVSAGADANPKNVALTSDAGTISGLIASAASGPQNFPRPQANICVTALNGVTVYGATVSSQFTDNNQANYTLSGLAPGNYTVRFDSCQRTPSNWVTQNHAGVNVVSLGNSVLNAALTPLGIVALGPATGTHLGGTQVIISGSGFTGATSVSFDGNSVAPCGAPPCFTVVSDAAIIVTTPSHPMGPVQVSVQTPSGRTNSLPYKYS
jgi:IPT/TIG domain